MSVKVDKASDAPKLSGRYEQDINALYNWARSISRTLNQVRERTGGTTDRIAEISDTANNASSTAAASQAGAVIPTPGGAVTLTPAHPLSYTLLSDSTAQIDVAGHIRSDAGSPIVAGSVALPVVRGLTYYVYYSDAGDLGGVVTFHASATLGVVTATVGYRIIDTISIPPFNYGDRQTSSSA